MNAEKKPPMQLRVSSDGDFLFGNLKTEHVRAARKNFSQSRATRDQMFSHDWVLTGLTVIGGHCSKRTDTTNRIR